MSIAEQILGDIQRSRAATPIPQYPQAQPFPRSPLNVMPRHLNIPNVGPSLPMQGTPVNFPTRGAIPTSTANASRLATLARGAGSRAASSTAGRSLASSAGGRLLSRAAGNRFVRGGGLAIGAELAGTALGNLAAGGAEDKPGFDRADVGEAITGGFRGAAAGRMFGNYGMVGGAVLGAGAGALDVIGTLFGGEGDDKPPGLKDPRQALSRAMAGTGLNEETRRVIKDSALAQLELATTDDEKLAVLQNAAATIQQESLRSQQAQQQLAHSLALQAQATQIFQPYAEANQRNADLARVLYADAGQYLPPAQKHLAAQFTLGAQQQSDALTQNLVTNATAQPRIDALIAHQQQVDSVANQLVQQALAQQMGGGGGGGAVDVEALLSEAGAL